MKAIVYRKYGTPDVLELEEVEKPAPKDDEVLVKIQAASANAYDWHLLSADIFLVRLMGGGLLKPPKRTRPRKNRHHCVKSLANPHFPNGCP